MDKETSKMESHKIVIEKIYDKHDLTNHFYKRLGFEVLKERNKGTMPMYLDLVANVKFNT